MNEAFEKIVSSLPGFEVREGQLDMFRDVLAAYEQKQTVLIEAGTGTGKSLAYLIPAIMWALKEKEPTVIATHTIALQEQLMQKDIPFLLEALNVDLKAVLVKGMSNYVCLRKLYDSENEIPESLMSWSKETLEGSRTELPILPSADLWDQIGAEAENCTHVKCPHYKQCFFFKARKNAADAHLIVANHHLLFADLTVRLENDNYEEVAVLPAFKRLILDEAHHCEDVATHYFAKNVSLRGINHSLGRLFSDRGTGKFVTLFRKICEAYPAGDILKESLTITLPAQKRKLTDLANQAFQALSFYMGNRKSEDKFRIREWHLNDTHWQEHVQPAVEVLLLEAKSFLAEVNALERSLKNLNDALLDNKCTSVLAEISGISQRLEKTFEDFFAFAFVALETGRVRWIEGNGLDLQLISAELEIGARLADALFEKLPTIVLCSATLTAHGTFTFIRKRLGIKNCQEKIYVSPFNYKEHTLLSVPTDLPDPSEPVFVQKAAEYIWKLVEVSRGGAFVLFTSYSMLRECAKMLEQRMHKNNYLLCCHGAENRSALLRKFRSHAQAVLFGTDSFWEGVDVAGDALRCVIIVKLPFKVPSDPLFQARSEAIASQGGSAFFDYSLPHAIVKFKQGFGRLIRNKEDKGCVICLDSRLVKKGYGKKIIQSLPECSHVFEPLSTCLNSLQHFYTSSNSLLKSSKTIGIPPI